MSCTSTTCRALGGEHCWRSGTFRDAVGSAGSMGADSTVTAIEVPVDDGRARSAYAMESTVCLAPGCDPRDRPRCPPVRPLCVEEAARSPTQRTSPTASTMDRRVEEECRNEDQELPRGHEEEHESTPNFGIGQDDKGVQWSRLMEIEALSGCNRWRCGSHGMRNLCDNVNGRRSDVTRRTLQMPGRSWCRVILACLSLCADIYYVGGICIEEKEGHWRCGGCGFRRRRSLCVNPYLAEWTLRRRSCWRCGLKLAHKLRVNVHSSPTHGEVGVPYAVHWCENVYLPTGTRYPRGPGPRGGESEGRMWGARRGGNGTDTCSLYSSVSAHQAKLRKQHCSCRLHLVTPPNNKRRPHVDSLGRPVLECETRCPGPIAWCRGRQAGPGLGVWVSCSFWTSHGDGCPSADRWPAEPRQFGARCRGHGGQCSQPTAKRLVDGLAEGTPYDFDGGGQGRDGETEGMSMSRSQIIVDVSWPHSRHVSSDPITNANSARRASPRACDPVGSPVREMDSERSEGHRAGRDGTGFDQCNHTCSGRLQVRSKGPRRSGRAQGDQQPRIRQVCGKSCGRRMPKPGATRYGEARHPGPAQSRLAIGAVEYKAPHREDFRGALMKRVDGELGESAEVHKMKGLLIETCNSTSWGPLKRHLRRTNADVVLAQEHHIGPGEVPAKSAWAVRAGWHAVFAPAMQGEGRGWRAGVAIMARPHVGLSLPRVGSHIVIPHRAVAATIEPQGYRPMTLVSLYLEDGKGVGPDNLEHLASVGAFVKSQGEDMPYVVGGDFQAAPADVANTAFASQLNGELVASGCVRGTCRSTRHNSEIDFFVVHKHLAIGVDSVMAVEGAGTRPHVPVALAFKPRLVSARALVLRQPPRISTTRIVGPLPPPPAEWGDVAAEIKRLLMAARTHGFAVDDAFRDKLEVAYSRWADVAELEIIHAAEDGHDVPIKGTRGKRPQLRWRSVLPERPPRPVDDDEILTEWRSLANVLAEMKRVTWQAGAHNELADDDAADDEPVDGGAERRAEQARQVDWDELAEVIGGIRDQLNQRGDMGQSADDRNGHRAANPSADADDGNIEYRVAVVRMRALAATIDIELRNARGTGAIPTGEAAAGLTRAAEWAQQLGEEIDGKITAVAAKAKRSAQHGWRSWIQRNLHAGAKNAHRFLRLPEEWRPTTVIDPDGVTTADPLKLVEGYSAKYNELWNGEGGGDWPAVATGADDDRANKPWQCGGHEPLPRPTPEELRAASRTFSPETAIAYDGIAMRHYEWLSDVALESLADVLEVVERTGELPRQLGALAMPMLPKPRGGHRAIATFVSIYRLWNRLRRDIVRRWEESVDRHYFAAGSARAPQDAVWRQAARAEAAVAEHKATATVLWDLAAFFESVKRVPLWFRARRLGFPPTIAAVSLNAYGAVRLLSLAGALSRPVGARNGVPAGCGYAMAFTRAYCIEAFDRVTHSLSLLTPTPPRLCAYVDDIALSAEGTTQQVIMNLQAAVEVLRDEVEGPLACRIETDKAAVVASSKRLMEALRAKFGKYAGPAAPGKGTGAAAVNLGIDFAPGRKRRAHGPTAKRRLRINKLRKQLGRVSRLRAVAGRRTPSIFVAGPLAAATYGASVNGVSDIEALRLRRAAAHAFTPRARGRSLRKLLLIVGVPTWKAEVAVILQYAREVWAAGLLGHRPPTDGQMTLSQISRVWSAVKIDDVIIDNGTKRVWNAAKGPISAMHLSLHRIGWKMHAPFEVVNDLGDTLILTKVAPKLLEHLLKEAVDRTLQREVGLALAADDHEFVGRRAAAVHVAAQLKTDKRLSPLDRAAYMSVACGALMTQDRAQRAGYIVPNICSKCGHGPDTAFHRVWKCQAADVVEARNSVAPQWLQREAATAQGASTSVFWVSGFIPHPGDVWPRPDEGNDAQWEWTGASEPAATDRSEGGKPQLHGKMYIDGSCTKHVYAELQRAASSIVQWSEAGGGGWVVKYPVPRIYPQTPQSAEYIALALTRQATDTTRPSDVASDCANVVNDATVRRRAATKAGRKYAAINRENLADTAWVRSAVVRKVPAHVNPTAVPEGPRREDAVGNDKADTAAKQAVMLHAQAPPAMSTMLEAQLRRARLVVRTIAVVTQKFPPMPKERMTRPPRPVEGSTVEVAGGHSWSHASGMWRCTRCYRLTLSPTVGAAQLAERCKGAKPSMCASVIAAKGHQLAITTGHTSVIFCLKCGSFATRRAYGLAANCAGRPTPAGKQALARIRAGQQPWENRGEIGARRLISQRPMAWDQYRGAYVGLGPTVGRTRTRCRQSHRRAMDESSGADQRGDAVDADGEHDRRVGGDGGAICRDDEPGRGQRGCGHADAGSAGRSAGDDLAQAQGQCSQGGAARGADADGGMIHLSMDTDGATDGSATGDGQRRHQKRTSVRLHSDHDGHADDRRGMAKRMKACPSGSGGGVRAVDTDQSVTVARVGPRGAAEAGATAAAVVTAAAVASQATVTLLHSAQSARCARAQRGKVTLHPTSGSAAPLDDSEDVAMAQLGQVTCTSSQTTPQSACGGSPHERREQNSPQKAPTKNLRAGLGSQGQHSVKETGNPPGVERRRDGNSDPCTSASAARGRGVAADPGAGEEPQRGSPRHIPEGAQQRECASTDGMQQTSCSGSTGGGGGKPDARQACEGLRDRRDTEQIPQGSSHRETAAYEHGGERGLVPQQEPLEHASSSHRRLHRFRGHHGTRVSSELRPGGRRRAPSHVVHPREDGDNVDDIRRQAGAREGASEDLPNHGAPELAGAALGQRKRQRGEVIVRGITEAGLQGGSASRNVDEADGATGHGPHRERVVGHRRDGHREHHGLHSLDAPHGGQECDGGHREHEHWPETPRGHEECDPRARHRHGPTEGNSDLILNRSGTVQSTRVGTPEDATSSKRVSRGGASGSEAEWSAQNSLPPALRPDRPGHRSCKRRRAAPRGSAPSASGAPSPFEQEERTWVMPWERQPSWLYLPHLLDRDTVGQQDGGETQAHDGVDNVNSRGDDQSLGHARGGHLAAAETRGDGAGGASVRRAISGRHAPPGPVHVASRGDEVGGAAVGTARIRGPLTEPGPRCSGGSAATAQQRLNARNAHLGISLAQHAERVRKRNLECPNAGAGPTPAERIAALRRRIEERRMHGGPAHNVAEDAGSASCGAAGIDKHGRAEAARWSNEDPYKIHQCTNNEDSVYGIRDDTAGGGGRGGRDLGAGSSHGAQESFARGDGHNSGADGVAVSAMTAAEWAAGHVAWHTNAQWDDAD